MTGYKYDNRYHKYPDGIHDEYPSSCKSTIYDYLIMDHDAAPQ